MHSRLKDQQRNGLLRTGGRFAILDSYSTGLKDVAARERVNASLQTSYGGDASTKTSEDRGDYIPGIEYSINEQEDCQKDTSKWRETKCKIEERTKQCLSEHGDVDLGELLKRGVLNTRVSVTASRIVS